MGQQYITPSSGGGGGGPIAIANVTGLQTALDGKADDATTLSGYGITDAYTKTEADTLLAGKSATGHTHTSTEVSFSAPTGFPDSPTSVDGALKSLKDYSDSLAQGITAKKEVKAATTIPITLSGEQTLDGISCVDGDRVLVKDQSNAAENGIYVVKTGVWDRATDFDAPAEASGAYVFVQQGTTWADTGWVVTSDSIATIGTSPINWSQFSRAGVVQAGTGITKTGNAIVSLANAYATTAGSGTNYTLTVAEYPSTIASLEGYSIKFKANRSATGTITLNVNGSSAKQILTSDGLNVGTLTANSVYTVVYNGSAFILQGEGGEIRSASKLTTKTIKVDESVVRGDVLEAYYRDINFSIRLSNDTNFTPPSPVNTVAWSPDNQYLAVGYGLTPYIVIYKRDGSAMTRLTNAIPSQPSGPVYSISFSPDGSTLTASASATNSFAVWRKTGEFWDRISVTQPSPTTGNLSYITKWSPTNLYCAVATFLSPFLHIYRRPFPNASGSEIPIRITTPLSSGVPTDVLYGISWHPKITNLFAIYTSSTVYLYDWNGVITAPQWSRLTGDNQSILALDRLYTYESNLSWSPSGTYLAVALISAPSIRIYKFDSTTKTFGSALTITGTMPAGCLCVNWSPDEMYVSLTRDSSVGGSGAEGVYIYKRNGVSFSYISNFYTTRTLYAEWSSDSKYFATFDNNSSTTNKYPDVYENTGQFLFTKLSSHTNEIGSLDKVIAVARQNGNAGDTIAASIIVGSNNV